MKRISKSMIGFFLILVLMLSLCACAQKQLTGTEIDEPNISTDRETLPGKPDEKLPEKLHSETGESDEQSKQAEFSAAFWMNGAFPTNSLWPVRESWP